MRIFVLIVLIGIFVPASSVSTYSPSELPVNAKTLSMLNLGVASDYNNWLNPASVEYNNEELLEFSQNSWIYDDVLGINISYHSPGQALLYHQWKIDDIQLYEDVPSNIPSGSFSSQNLFLHYSKSFKIKSLALGFNIGAMYQSLFNWEDRGLKFDFGFQKPIGDNYKLGFAVQNLYSQNRNSDRLPKLIVIGVKQKINNLPIIIYFDLFEHENNGLGSFQAIKLASKNLNLIFGAKYLKDFEKTDFSLGMNLRFEKIQFSISTLFLENSSFKSPMSYQISYFF
tara:strand:+ start:4126 stop:4977 length:852 start_codon:yes stop_codon:yes gene_type:complete